MIKLENINKEYQGTQNDCVALKNISFELPGKGLVFICGHSGSGKTTLLNIISGLDKPTSGSIVNKYDNEYFFSYIFQDFQLINYLTIKENILLAGQVNEMSESLDELVDKYDIRDVLDHYPNEVSGGQKQRAAIVRALYMNKPVILCDEPTGNLDEDNSLIIAKALKEESMNKLVIVVSHDYDMFEPVADRIIELKKGVISSDTIKEENNEFENTSIKDAKLSFKNSMFILWNYFKKNKFRHFLMLVSIFLSFFLMLTALNIFSLKDGTIISNVYNKEDYAVVDMRKATQNFVFNRNLSSEEREVLKEKYDADFYYDNKGSYFESLNPSRVYVSDEINRKLLYGNSKLDYLEVSISDYYASAFGYDESCIGTKIGDYTISSVFKTGYNPNVQYSPEEMDKKYRTIYINQSSYEYTVLKHENTKFSIVTYIRDENDKGNFTVYNRNCDEIINEYGNIVLAGNEIIINENYAREISSDISSLVGKAITINAINIYGYDGRTREIVKSTNKYSFVVKQVVSNMYSTGFFAIVSDEMYETIAVNNCWDDSENCYMGISLQKYSAKQINTLIGKDFLLDSYLTESLDNGMSWIDEMNGFALIVGCVLALISVFITINFVHSLFDKEKRTQGVLASFGIEKKKILSMYFIDIVFMMIIPLLLSAALLPVVNFGINQYLINKDVCPQRIIYFEVLPVLYLVLIALVVLILIYLVVYLKMRKKAIVDIIYER